MTSLAYAVVVQPLTPEVGGGYLATVPDLPGFMSDGETREEAVTHVADAIDSWIEAAHDLGHVAPAPGRRIDIAALPFERAA